MHGRGCSHPASEWLLFSRSAWHLFCVDYVAHDLGVVCTMLSDAVSNAQGEADHTPLMEEYHNRLTWHGQITWTNPSVGLMFPWTLLEHLRVQIQWNLPPPKGEVEGRSLNGPLVVG